MIGEVCRFYGWKDEDALKMPAARFFVMLEASRDLRNKEHVYNCYTARAANASPEAFDELVEFFRGLDIPKKRPEPVIITVEEPSAAAFKSGTVEANYAVMSMFAADKRIHRRPH